MKANNFRIAMRIKCENVTLPRPQRTKVPIKARFLCADIPIPLSFKMEVHLMDGSVSPVKLDSSTRRSTDYV